MNEDGIAELDADEQPNKASNLYAILSFAHVGIKVGGHAWLFNWNERHRPA